jgi:hypothetical protein
LSPELDAKLRAAYPHIFVFEPTAVRDERNTRLARSPFSHRSFECDDGWYDLIDALCSSLQNATEIGAPQVVVVEVKEELGSLRFYARGQDAKQGGMIELAEVMSARICEVCGDRGRLRKSGWLRTRCLEHDKS